MRVITRGVAVFGTARPQGKTFKRCSIVSNGCRKQASVSGNNSPNHAGRKRHSDASARVSLAGCVPAEPAAVSPRFARMPHRPPFVTCLINAVNCGMNMVRILPIERSHAPRSSCSLSSHTSTVNSRSEWMQMTCMNRFWNFRKTSPVVSCLSVTRRQGPTPVASAAFAARKAPP